MFPQEKYIFNVPPSQYGLHSDSYYYFFSQFCNKQNATRRCKFSNNSNPPFLLKFLFPKCKYFIFNTISVKSMMVPVETFQSFRLLSRFLKVGRPTSCGMFGYKPTTCTVHKKCHHAILVENGAFLGNR